MVPDTSQTNILVAVSNRVLRDSLCHVLNGQPSLAVLAESPGNSGALPDLVLFDASRTLAELQAGYPSAKFILLDPGLKEQEVTYLLLFHKIAGVIPPETDLELFFKALKVIKGGQLWVANNHLKAMLGRNGSLTPGGGLRNFSSQDMEIVHCVVRGLSNKEIASQLCLSEHTIKAHLGRIFKLLNITRRVQLAALFLELDQNHQLLD